MRTKFLLLILAMLSAWLLETKAQCTSGNMYGNVGFVNDGGTQSNYTNGENCAWLIESAMGSRLGMGFYNFVTEDIFDVLTIYDGVDANAPVLGTYSGNTVPPYLETTGRYMYITWTTDGSVTYLGWDAWWRSLQAHLTTCEGQVSDGTIDYLNDQTLDWLIQPTGADAITFDLHTMNTEPYFDFVRIYDGVDANAPLLGEFSGTQTGVVTSTGGSMYVKFTSDGTVPGVGFSASYSCSTCSGQTTLTAPSGFVADGSDGGNYGNNQNCTWLIQPPGALSIQINFSGLLIEQCCDFVKVYDGVNNAAPLLANVTTWNQSISTSGGAAFVEFTTDNSVTDAGFEFYYNSNSVGVEESESTGAQLDIYPNPNHGSFRLDISNTNMENGAQVDIMDNTGRLVHTEWIQTTSAQFDLNYLASGLYLLRLDNGVERFVRRFVVE